MRLGVNALGQIRGGTLEHLRQLLARWAELVKDTSDTLTVFSSAGTLQRLGCIPPNVRIVPVTFGDWGVVLRVIAEQLLLPLLVFRHNIDVLFSAASTAPIFPGIASVVMLQNAAPFLPASELRKLGVPTRVRLLVLRWFMRASVSRAAAVIFLSDTFRRSFNASTKAADASRREEVVFYHARPACVVADGAEVETFTRALGISGPYLLCVSHIYPYKNLVELITGFGLIGTDTVQLVVVGEAVLQDKYLSEVTRAARAASRFPRQVLLAGALSHRHVGLLLRGCMAFVFPSTCENCPVALIEALTYRLPIACSNAGVMPEMVGEAAILFDPYQPADIARALRTLISEPGVRTERARRSEAELARFRAPGEVADATWQLLSRVATRRSRRTEVTTT